MVEKVNRLYQQVVEVTYDYLGPAADRFIDRQIRNHLEKRPEQLLEQDLNELIDWIRLAMGLLTNDNKMINKYIRSLKLLTIAARKTGTNDKTRLRFS